MTEQSKRKLVTFRDLKIPPRPQSVPPLEITPQPEIEPALEIRPPVIETSRPIQNVPAIESAPRPESKPTGGFLKLSNHFIYDLMPTLKPSDGYVLLYLMARTHGFNETRLVVTLDTVADACHISRSQARISLRALEKRNHIKIIKIDRDNRNPLLRGIHLQMLVPYPETKGGTNSAPRPKYVPRSRYVPIKERDYKRQDIKEPSLEDIAEWERNQAELNKSKV